MRNLGRVFMMAVVLAVLVVAAGPGAQQQPAPSVPIRVLASNGVRAVFVELLPRFERANGRRLETLFGTTASIKQRIEKGEAFDVVIVTSEAVDDFIKTGKLAGATRADIARSGIGVGIRKGAHKPDIRTPEALKRGAIECQVADLRRGRREPGAHREDDRWSGYR